MGDRRYGWPPDTIDGQRNQKGRCDGLISDIDDQAKTEPRSLNSNIGDLWGKKGKKADGGECLLTLFPISLAPHSRILLRDAKDRIEVKRLS